MSFNAFPIPDILEQLKSPVVDDKIHDIAERKHVFEGPMRLSPGRLYFYFCMLEREKAQTSASANMTIGALNIAYYNAVVSEKYWRSTGLIYVSPDGMVYANTLTNGSNTEKTAQYGGTAYTANRFPDNLLFEPAFAAGEWTVNDFVIVEV